jgi:hypothetical protein
MASEYRKHLDTDTWHFCSNCSPRTLRKLLEKNKKLREANRKLLAELKTEIKKLKSKMIPD